MKDCRVRLRLESPAGTPWQSDTLFGHLAWQVTLGRGGIPIEEFLAPFLQGPPPFVLSDGFPSGLLPRPVFPPGLEPGEYTEPTTVHEASLRKKRKKAPWVEQADFQCLRCGQPAAGEPVADPWRTILTAHASLDRRNLRTGGDGATGEFFETESRVLEHEGESLLDLYIRFLDETWMDRVLGLLEDLSHTGYGRDKSVGLGAFRVEGCEPFDGFSEIEDPSAVILLSSVLPAAKDPIHGAWRLRVKRGKLGEAAAGRANPFKYPLLMLEPGAILQLSLDEAPAPCYGRCAETVSPAFPEAVQNGWGLAVPCKVSPKPSEASK